MSPIRFMKTSIVIGALVLSSSVMAQTTKIDNGNGETTTVTTTKENTTIERGAKETNNETHKQAVERVKKEYQDKGEKATVIK